MAKDNNKNNVSGLENNSEISNELIVEPPKEVKELPKEIIESPKEEEIHSIHLEMFPTEKQYFLVNRSIEPVNIFLKNGEAFPVASKGTSKAIKKSDILRISKPSAIGYREV